MDAPSIMATTHKKPKETKMLNIFSDKKREYEILLYIIEENLIIEAKTKNVVPQKNFEKSFSINEIQKNKYFGICENIDEIFEEIKGLIEGNEDKIHLIEETNSLILGIPINTKKIKECLFQIDEKISDTKQKIDELYSYINTLLDKIKELENKNQSLEKSLNEINEKLNPIYNKFKEKEEKKNDDLKKVKQWIDPNKNITLNLIFKKSRDGNTTQSFHNYCDNKGKTLIMIETTKGRKFGGFTNENWDLTDKWKKNINDFVFSLDLNKKYNHNQAGDSIIGCKKNGPVFGNSRDSQVDICFNNNSLDFGISNNGSFNTNKELNNGEERFETLELEVYQVIIN
jgi:hypothetical protein